MPLPDPDTDAGPSARPWPLRWLLPQSSPPPSAPAQAAPAQSPPPEGLLAAVADSLADQLATLDAQGRITHANAAWHRLGEFLALADVPAPALGAPVGTDLLALWQAEAGHPAFASDCRHQAAAALQALLAGDGPPFERDCPGRGALAGRWFRLALLPLRGNRRGVVLISTEITQRKNIENALRESEQRFRVTFDNSAVGIAEHRLDGSWISANPRMSAITGYAAEQLLSLGPGRLTHADDVLPSQIALYRLVLGWQESVRIEKRYLRADGSTVWVARTSSLVRDGQGRPLHLVSVIEDISERKAVEAELAQQRAQLEQQVAERTRALEVAMRARAEGERFLRSVTDVLPDRVAYWDPQGVCRFANRAYVQEVMPPGSDGVGLRREQVIPAEDLALTEGLFQQALAGQAGQLQHSFEAGRRMPQHVWIHYLPDRHPDGRVVGVFVLMTDVTEIKQAELRLRSLNEQLVAARDRAEQANRAKSAFLANMSHEIRTPMNAIIGLTHLMQRDLRDEAALARLDKVSTAAHHLLDVINDVLDLSKIESGKLEIDASDFAISALLSRVVSLTADRARGKGLSLVVQTEGLPRVLRGDPTRVSQALLNLLSNAVKFTDHGGIVLRCERVDPQGLAAVADGSMTLRFSVSDSGVGVPPERLPQLFSAFEQADASTTRRFGGTGLGLAITRRLAEMMGGEVGVDSQLGQGSCFWFTARFAAASAGLADGPLAETPALQGEHLAEARAHHEHRVRERHLGASVLLAEDNLINQEVAGELLRAAGLRVDMAVNGREAVALAAERPYDLILMDMQMPELDGLSATRQIRQLPGHGQTPILAMTANAFGDDRQACLDAGMDDHLAKPVDPGLLYAMLERWLPARANADALAPPHGELLPGQAQAQAPAQNDDDALFAAIPGLQVSQALMFLPGRAAVFVRVLGQFIEHYGQGLPGQEAALQSRRWSELGLALHSLRGACGAIGASALGAQCRALEQALPAADGQAPQDALALDQALRGLQHELQSLISAMRSALTADQARRQAAGGGAGAANGAPAGPAARVLSDAGTGSELDTALDDLDTLLRVADFRAGALHRELEPRLRARHGAAAVQPLAAALRQHDYEQALRRLRELRGGLPSGQ
ncbi:MAG: PAS domain S-box protein [Burkholderiaceae bacterium]|nr:PAS domain S-box protein [Burkholderiaceae bacterium]